MIIVMTGGTGLVGQALGQKLSSKNYKIHLLVRKPQNTISYPCKTFLWPDVKADLPQEVFPKEEEYGVIHLAGEPISKWPWTKGKKEKIYSSRVEAGRKLVTALKKCPHPPQFFLSASAIGIYADQGNRQVTEESPIADQDFFLQKLCKDWEKEALKAAFVCRVLVFRLGIVMSYKKGFLYEQAKWLKRGLLPLLITQKPNWLSWISLEDLICMLLWAIESKEAKGIYNAVSPHAVSLKDFYKIFAKQKNHKGIALPFPLFLMKLMGGEMTKNLLASCKVFPEKALSEGFVFRKSKLEEALKNIS